MEYSVGDLIRVTDGPSYSPILGKSGVVTAVHPCIRHTIGTVGSKTGYTLEVRIFANLERRYKLRDYEVEVEK